EGAPAARSGALGPALRGAVAPGGVRIVSARDRALRPEVWERADLTTDATARTRALARREFLVALARLGAASAAFGALPAWARSALAAGPGAAPTPADLIVPNDWPEHRETAVGVLPNPWPTRNDHSLHR